MLENGFLSWSPHPRPGLVDTAFAVSIRIRIDLVIVSTISIDTRSFRGRGKGSGKRLVCYALISPPGRAIPLVLPQTMRNVDFPSFLHQTSNPPVPAGHFLMLHCGRNCFQVVLEHEAMAVMEVMEDDNLGSDGTPTKPQTPPPTILKVVSLSYRSHS